MGSFVVPWDRSAQPTAEELALALKGVSQLSTVTVKDGSETRHIAAVKDGQIVLHPAGHKF